MAVVLPKLSKAKAAPVPLDPAIAERIAAQKALRQLQAKITANVAWGRTSAKAIESRPPEKANQEPLKEGVHRRSGPSATTLSSRSLEERLFDKAAALKAQMARVAMHLSPDWRSGLFENLDRLLDAEEWDYEENDFPTPESFTTFLRMAIFLGDIRRPGLGMTGRGTIVAVWMRGRDKLTVECLPNDSLRWVFATHDNDQRESVAGETSVKKLREILQSVGPGRWFDR